MADLEPDSPIVVQTVSRLSPFVAKSHILPKKLAKPPFKYLYEIIKETGYAAELYQKEEYALDNVNENRDLKISFMKELFAKISSDTNEQIDVNPVKILCGKECDKTNTMLQRICDVLDKVDMKSPQLSKTPAKKASTEAENTPKKEVKKSRPEITPTKKKQETSKKRKETATEEARMKKGSQEKPGLKKTEKEPAKTKRGVKSSAVEAQKRKRVAKKKSEEDLSEKKNQSEQENLNEKATQESPEVALDTTVRAKKRINKEEEEAEIEEEAPRQTRRIQTKKQENIENQDSQVSGFASRIPNRKIDSKLIEKPKALIIKEGEGETIEEESKDGVIVGEMEGKYRMNEDEVGIAVRDIRKAMGEVGDENVNEREQTQMLNAAQLDRTNFEKMLNIQRDNIQGIMKTVLPLAKLIDFLQEDIEFMTKEKEHWNNEILENTKAFQEAEGETKKVLDEFEAKVREKEDQIQEQMSKNTALKALIQLNEETIQTFYKMVVSRDSK